MTITDQQAVFDAIKATDHDNAKTWTLASQISTNARNLIKSTTQQVTAEITRENDGQSKRTPLPDDATDSEVRTRARLLLMDKLNDGSITASEFSQFKDVFNLASATDDLSITVIQYDNMLIECPGCGLNLHEPDNEPTVALTEG